MSDPVVSAAWLDDHRDTVRIVDVRDAWEYDALGHVPGAVNVPFDTFRADEHAVEAGTAAGDTDRAAGGRGDGGSQGMLPAAADFADLMGRAGVTRADEVVAYDDHHGVFAARLLVTLELFGHPPARLHLLDGDFSAWQLEYGTATEAADVAETTYEVREPVDSPLVSAEDMAAAADDPGAVVVDTREASEYEAGHIPGAVRLDWRELVDDETRGLLSRDELESVLADRGIGRDRRVLLYCNTARRISHTYTVLRHLGYEDVGFYEGSLAEWEAAGRPVETA